MGMDSVLLILGALASGSFIGMVLGFVGAGGAMLAVPLLVYGFSFTPAQATTAALAIVFCAALAGSIPKVRAKEILYREAGTIWALGLLTNIGFSLIVHQLSEKFLSSGFALILFLAALSMLAKPITESERRAPLGALVLTSLLIGSITGLFGIGGGFIAIPILVLFFGTPQRIAAGTSLAIISVNSLTALLGHYSAWDTINWKVPITMALSAVLVSAWASQTHSRVPAKTLKRAFSALLFSLALFTLVETWFF